MRLKKSMFSSIILTIAVFTLYGCLSSNDQLSKNSTTSQIVKSNQEVSIYLYDGDAKQALKLGMEFLALEKHPIIITEDIVYYDWSEHILVIRKNDFIDKVNEGRLHLHNQPFVITVDDQRIYMGFFWSSASSAFSPKTPLIEYFGDPKGETGIYHFKILSTRLSTGDVRYDKRLYDALEENDKIH